jgi:amino acid transporter
LTTKSATKSVTESAPADIFVRKASGLRREWHSYDAFFYNFLQIDPAFNLYLPFIITLIPGLFVGANLPLAWLLGVIFLTPTMLTYAMMSASMPRSGGEYVFISRLLHPSLGFSFVTLGFTLANLAWITSVGQVVIGQQGVGIPLYVLGTVLNQPALLNASAWVSSQTGSMVVVIVLGVLVPAFLVSLGMRIYAYVQRIFMAVTIIGSVFLIAAFAAVSQPMFEQAFNAFNQASMGPNAYSQLIDAATKTGYAFTTQFSVSGTIVATVLTMSMLMWAWFSTPLLGEIKSAAKLKSTALFIWGPMVAVGAYQILFSILLPQMVGAKFLGAMGYLWNTGGIDTSKLPVPPYHNWYVLMVFPFWWVALIMMLGFVFHGIYANCSNLLGPVRYLFAQSFDRILPSKIAYVEPRTRTPLVALLIMVVGSIVWAAWQLANPSLWTYITSAAFSTLAVVIGVCAAGAIFPYRMPDAYKQSPAAKFNVGGIPLITIVGILGIGSQLFLGYYYVTVAALGNLGTSTSMFALIGIAVLLIIYYFGVKWYRNQRGTRIAFAFREIPPE